MAKEEKEKVESVPEEEEIPVREGSGRGDKNMGVEETVARAASSLKDAFESLGKAMSEALRDRGNVVMVRVNDDALAYLDMLVDADICKSRSESAAFLINEGVKANDPLFDRIKTITDQIAELRAKLREAALKE